MPTFTAYVAKRAELFTTERLMLAETSTEFKLTRSPCSNCGAAMLYSKENYDLACEQSGDRQLEIICGQCYEKEKEKPDTDCIDVVNNEAVTRLLNAMSNRLSDHSTN